MNRLGDSRRAWLGVKNPVDGMGPGLVRQCRENYEADLLARIEELMDAKAGTPEGDELRALADEWIAHEAESDSDATAIAAINEDLSVPEDLQARPERIAQNPSGSLE